jgi:nitrite reductase/ring-hydroxylating ferredoxin subunit
VAPSVHAWLERSARSFAWHGSCYDLQAGEIRAWCPLLNRDGTASDYEFLGDTSMNLAPLEVFQSRVADGQFWVSLDRSH